MKVIKPLRLSVLTRIYEHDRQFHLAVSVLAHRVLPSTEAQLARRSVSEIITKAVQSAPVPDKR